MRSGRRRLGVIPTKSGAACWTSSSRSSSRRLGRSTESRRRTDSRAAATARVGSPDRRPRARPCPAPQGCGNRPGRRFVPAGRRRPPVGFIELGLQLVHDFPRPLASWRFGATASTQSAAIAAIPASASPIVSSFRLTVSTPLRGRRCPLPYGPSPSFPPPSPSAAGAAGSHSKYWLWSPPEAAVSEPPPAGPSRSRSPASPASPETPGVRHRAELRRRPW